MRRSRSSGRGDLGRWWNVHREHDPYDSGIPGCDRLRARWRPAGRAVANSFPNTIANSFPDTVAEPFAIAGSKPISPVRPRVRYQVDRRHRPSRAPARAPWSTPAAPTSTAATPPATGDVIAKLASGATVPVTGATQSGWVPVTCGGQAGWVSAQYLSITSGGGRRPRHRPNPPRPMSSCDCHRDRR